MYRIKTEMVLILDYANISNRCIWFFIFYI